MGTRKKKTQKEISSSKQTPTKVETPVIRSKIKPKSDLTLAFMDSATYIKDLARHNEMGQRIDRLRKSAISQQWRTTIDQPYKTSPLEGEQTPQTA
jgi:hypothetical protein